MCIVMSNRSNFFHHLLLCTRVLCISTWWLCVCVRSEIKDYLPSQDGLRSKLEEVYSFCLGQIAVMHSLSPQGAKIRFIGKWYLFSFLLFAVSEDSQSSRGSYLEVESWQLDLLLVRSKHFNTHSSRFFSLRKVRSWATKAESLCSTL